MKVLYVSSSPMGDKSISRSLGNKFFTELKAKHSNVIIVERDLNKNPLPHLNFEILGAFVTPVDKQDVKAKDLLKTSDALIKELLDADMVVIASPMWNFGMPSVMKAWVDHICRVGLTFKYTETGPIGLVTGKKAVVLSSRGGIYSEGAFKTFEHEESHIVNILQFLGFKDIKSVHAEGVAYGDDAMKKAVAKAENEVSNLVKSL